MDKHFYDKDVHKLPPAPPRFYCCGVKHDLDKTYGRAETLKENVIPQDKYVFWGIHSPQLYVERLTLVHLFQSAPQPWPAFLATYEFSYNVIFDPQHITLVLKSVIGLHIYKQSGRSRMYYSCCCNWYDLHSAYRGQAEKCFHWFAKILESGPLLTASVLPETESGDLTLVGIKGYSREQTPSHRPKTPL